MSDIPAARELVKAARQKLAAQPRKGLMAALDLLARAETMMHRERPSKPIAPARFGCTPAQAAQIRAIAAAEPSAQVLDIAHRVNTGIGRVSEVLSGKR